MHRYFIPVKLTKQVVLDNQVDVNHLKKVLRYRVFDQLILVNDNQAVVYQIKEINATNIICQTTDVIVASRELAVDIDICMPFLKNNNFELVIQKVTELGIKQIIPTIYQRSVVHKKSDKWSKYQTRLQAIIRSAAQQSQRNQIPLLAEITQLDAIQYHQYDLIIVAYERETTNNLIKYQAKISQSTKILVILGPEGGLDTSEIEYLQQFRQTIVITLGKRILRSETAQIAIVANIAMLIEGD